MKVHDTPQQARSLREIEANVLETASQKLNQIHGNVQPISTTEEAAAISETQEEVQTKKTSKKTGKKKDSQGV